MLDIGLFIQTTIVSLFDPITLTVYVICGLLARRAVHVVILALVASLGIHLLTEALALWPPTAFPPIYYFATKFVGALLVISIIHAIVQARRRARDRASGT